MFDEKGRYVGSECSECGNKKLIVFGKIGEKLSLWCPRCDKDWLETDKEYVKRTGRY